MAKGSIEAVCRCQQCGCPNRTVGAALCWLCTRGYHKPRKRR